MHCPPLPASRTSLHPGKRVPCTNVCPFPCFKAARAQPALGFGPGDTSTWGLQPGGHTSEKQSLQVTLPGWSWCRRGILSFWLARKNRDGFSGELRGSFNICGRSHSTDQARRLEAEEGARFCNSSCCLLLQPSCLRFPGHCRASGAAGLQGHPAAAGGNSTEEGR